MCTTMWLKNSNERLLAQNYDFYYGHGLVLVNPRGLAKVALGDDEANSARWVALHGSVTFNQVARELPVCGVNEQGLAVGSMWHDAVKPATARANGLVNELQWIQYQLDRHATVAEVVRGLEDVALAVAMLRLSLDAVDFSPAAPALTLDVEAPFFGDVSGRLQPYTREANERIVRKSFKPIEAQFPRREQDALIAYPDLLRPGD